MDRSGERLDPEAHRLRPLGQATAGLQRLNGCGWAAVVRAEKTNKRNTESRGTARRAGLLKIQSAPHAMAKVGNRRISDAHEWINEIPTVPIYYLAKLQPRERAWNSQRGKKTLLSLTLVRLCEVT